MIDSKKGQVTVFIIIGILVVASVSLFFILRNKSSSSNISPEFQSVYDDFVFCLQNKLSSGVNVLESKGGYISLTQFTPGSEFMPFSSQLNFLGSPIPYWYYVSGNNVEKTNVPTLNSMENELSNFMNGNIEDCIPEGFTDGTSITAGIPNSQVNIKSKEIILNLDMDLNMKKGETNSQSNSHQIILKSDLGNLYSNALKVYNSEQKYLFLENYTIDILNAYAPVDGVEISCSPKTWVVLNVFGDIQDAVQENVQALKSVGDNDDYFVVKEIKSQISNGVYVKFLNSKDWSTTIEVNPSQGELLIADPIGSQQGLGILGFCYAPYHFVYDLKYPVLVQVYSENTGEVFQFPLAVIVQGNTPRKPTGGEASVSVDSSEICSSADSNIGIYTVGSDSNSVSAIISYECFDQTCLIGSSGSNGNLNGIFPKCVNGYIIASADGYKDSEVEYTTITPGGSVQIVLDKLYDKEVQLKLGSQDYSGNALVTFTDADGEVQTISYPDQKKIILSQGVYNISFSAYATTSLNLGASTQQYCTEVPRGAFGIFGLTKNVCYDVEIPEQLISSALSGGGKIIGVSITEGNLKNSNAIVINGEKLPNPSSLTQIQENNILFDNKKLEVMFT